MLCGATMFRGFDESTVWSPNERLQPRSNYTRLKRFKKYLNRACRLQSCNTVPDETWEYLLSRGPYFKPLDVIRTLKRSKLRRKCYDSLPLLVSHLCTDVTVPMLTDIERNRAVDLFNRIDGALAKLPGQPFCSYLYVLEYILHKLNRPDVVPFCSRIQCRKRRTKYRELLNSVFDCNQAVPLHITC